MNVAQIRDVLFGPWGLAAHLQPGHVVLLCPTTAPQDVQSIDAPMSGGPARARDGTMTHLLAGGGARTKLVNNSLAGSKFVGAAEVMALARRMGLDLGHTLNVVAQSSGQSWIGTDRMRRAISGDLVFRAHMTLLAKATRLAQEAAQAVGFDGPLEPIAAKVFSAALDAGLSDQDDAALPQFLEPHPR